MSKANTERAMDTGSGATQQLAAFAAALTFAARILALPEGLVAQLLLLADHVAELVERLLHVAVAALTGLRQHTGNWPGKTVTRSEGAFQFGGQNYKLVDLPGTYSLLSASQDEEVARDFILFGQPSCTIVVTDATSLERNLNLVLQVMEITENVVVAINLMDEAKRKGLEVDGSG